MGMADVEIWRLACHQKKKTYKIQQINRHHPQSNLYPLVYTYIPPNYCIFPPISAYILPIFSLFLPIFSLFLPIFSLFLPIFSLFLPIFSLFLPIFSLFLPIFAYFTMKIPNKFPINPRRPDGPRAAAPCFGRFIDCFGRAKGAAYGRAAAVRSGCGKVGGGVAVAGCGWVAVGWLKSACKGDHFECLKSRIGAELSEL
jgi:hypothetical protein